MIFNVILKFPVNYDFSNPTHLEGKSTVQWPVSKTAIDHKHPNLMILETIPLLTKISPGWRFSWASMMLLSMPSTITSNDCFTNPRDVIIYTTYWR